MAMLWSSRTFSGGVHPPDHKGRSCEMPIEPGPPAREVAVLLCQHIGAICEAVVKKGDPVAAGQKVGDCQAFVSAPVHSPVAGKVKEVALRSHPVLGRAMAVVIAADPPDERPLPPDAGRFVDFDAARYEQAAILDAAREAGLVGMGGAGFPTRVKLDPKGTPKETLIVNACECEPYITCDYRLMLEWTDQVLAGVRLARKASGCKRAIIGIEDNKPRAIEVMRDACRAGADGIEVMPLQTKYPQGGERQLIRAVLGKNVPTGGIPPMIGVVVINVATAAALADAVVFGRPLTHRVVTVTGGGIDRPGNYYVPLGIAVGELIEFCGGLNSQARKVLMGGPMMGLAIADMETPLTKTSGAITGLTKQEIGSAKFAQRQTACIRCGRCLEACPERLNPTRIAHAVKNNLLDVAQEYYMSACIECGCCSYVCPANIELTGYIKTGKIWVARQKKRMPE